VTDELVEGGGLAQRTNDEGLRFARRMYLPRICGLALGVLCVGGALWQQGAHPLVWAALAVNAFVWPHVAYPLARRGRNPYRAELTNLVIDSASGGIWMAVIGFNLVPSAVLFSMLVMDKISVGGLRLLWRCLTAQVIAAVAVAFLTGFHIHLETSVMVVAASLPLLIIYPVMVGITTHQLARRVRRQNLTLAALSSTDGLSGLLNRMHWEKAVAGEFERCRRTKDNSAVLMIDIDHFKTVNDSYGHPAGDQVIRSVARILRGTVRPYDIAARYGGEEFGIVLPGTDIVKGSAIAERIRGRVDSAVLDERHNVHATISIGVAAFDAADDDHTAWIGRADQALYRAKAAGRNRSVIHNTLPFGKSAENMA
jgi:diguanylate cyclase